MTRAVAALITAGFLALTVATIGVTTALVHDLRQVRAMPQPDGDSGGLYPVGAVDCGAAYQEVISRDERVVAVRWWLNGEVLAVVYLTQNQATDAYVDYDRDGYWDERVTEGFGGPVNDWYAKACGDGASGWFR